MNELLWVRISEILRKQRKSFPDLWAKVERDKNTYTNWIRKRTIPKVSDLQELAAALGTTPAVLLSPPSAVADRADEQPEQMEFAFGMGGKSIQFEVEYTTAGLVLKKLGKAG